MALCRRLVAPQDNRDDEPQDDYQEYDAEHKDPARYAGRRVVTRSLGHGLVRVGVPGSIA